LAGRVSAIATPACDGLRDEAHHCNATVISAHGGA
jgi:hypothetical protein